MRNLKKIPFKDIQLPIMLQQTFVFIIEAKETKNKNTWHCAMITFLTESWKLLLF